MSHTREPAAWMYPCDIERFKHEEAFADAFSIAVGSNSKGETVPLYSADQMRELEHQRDELLEALSEIAYSHTIEYANSVAKQAIQKCEGKV